MFKQINYFQNIILKIISMIKLINKLSNWTKIIKYKKMP